jgi:hydroxyacylglutathione hydrolase
MKLTEKIHLLRIDFEIPVAHGKRLERFVNTLIIFGNRITLVDTGVRGSEKAIFRYIQENGRKIEDIETIILSHSHPDHIGSAAVIKDLTGCRVLSHEAEADWIKDIDLQNRERPVPGFFTLVDRPTEVDEYLAGGQVIRLADNLNALIIHSPGHSRGSLNILFIEDRILFTADSVPLMNDIPNYENYRELKNSLKAIEESGAYDVLLTSWTPPVIDKVAIEKILSDGEVYMKMINSLVMEFYPGNPSQSDACAAVIGKLGLPPFLASPLVNRAFLSHLS